jgi:hypothetical protein
MSGNPPILGAGGGRLQPGATSRPLEALVQLDNHERPDEPLSRHDPQDAVPGHVELRRRPAQCDGIHGGFAGRAPLGPRPSACVLQRGRRRRRDHPGAPDAGALPPSRRHGRPTSFPQVVRPRGRARPETINTRFDVSAPRISRSPDVAEVSPHIEGRRGPGSVDAGCPRRHLLHTREHGEQMAGSALDDSTTRRRRPGGRRTDVVRRARAPVNAR